MNFQKQKILNRLAELNWLVEEETIPRSQNNWKTTELIQLTKKGSVIFFAVEKDPTSGYLGGELSSGDYTVVISNFDPTDIACLDYEKIAEINLGKNWEEKLDDFIARIERYTGHKPYIIDLSASKMKTRSGFIRELKELFHFPPYCGDNLDAVHDCMTDLSWLPDKQIHVRIHGWKGVEKHHHFDYEEFFENIKQYWDRLSPNESSKTFVIEKK